MDQHEASKHHAALSAISATRQDRTPEETRLVALEMALRIHKDEWSAIRAARVFEDYLNGESV